MDMSGIIVLFMIIIGFLAGSFGSILGLGGGLIMLPVLQKILDFNPLIAVGTTLMAIAFTSLSGSYAHFRVGNVNLRVAIIIGIAGVAGVFLGSFIFKEYFTVQVEILNFSLGILFFLVAVRVLKDLIDYFKKDSIDVQDTIISTPTIYLLILGFIVGALAGMLGLGGGFILVPAMLYLFSFSPFLAVGTSLLSMLPITFIGGLIKYSQGFVDIYAALFLGLGSILGAQTGVHIIKYISSIWFKFIFLFLFLYMAYDYLLAVIKI